MTADGAECGGRDPGTHGPGGGGARERPCTRAVPSTPSEGPGGVGGVAEPQSESGPCRPDRPPRPPASRRQPSPAFPSPTGPFTRGALSRGEAQRPEAVLARAGPALATREPDPSSPRARTAPDTPVRCPPSVFGHRHSGPKLWAGRAPAPPTGARRRPAPPTPAPGRRAAARQSGAARGRIIRHRPRRRGARQRAGSTPRATPPLRAAGIGCGRRVLVPEPGASRGCAPCGATARRKRAAPPAPSRGRRRRRGRGPQRGPKPGRARDPGPDPGGRT